MCRLTGTFMHCPRQHTGAGRLMMRAAQSLAAFSGWLNSAGMHGTTSDSIGIYEVCACVECSSGRGLCALWQAWGFELNHAPIVSHCLQQASWQMQYVAANRWLKYGVLGKSHIARPLHGSAGRLSECTSAYTGYLLVKGSCPLGFVCVLSVHSESHSRTNGRAMCRRVCDWGCICSSLQLDPRPWPYEHEQSGHQPTACEVSALLLSRPCQLFAAWTW